MASILRVKLRWTGLPGGSGYSMFHFRDFAAGEPTDADASSAAARITNYAENLSELLPNAVTLQTESTVEVIEETNGQLVNFLTAPAQVAKQGITSSTVGWAAAAGAVISWSTNGVRNGRRVRGRSFVVPLANTSYDTDGSLTATTVTKLNTTATTLRDGAGTPDLGVYARPTAPGANDGIWYAVTGHRVPDMSAILRSRRS